MDRVGGLVVIAPARRAGDPGSIPGPGENFSLKLLINTQVLNELKITSSIQKIKVHKSNRTNRVNRMRRTDFLLNI